MFIPYIKYVYIICNNFSLIHPHIFFGARCTCGSDVWGSSGACCRSGWDGTAWDFWHTRHSIIPCQGSQHMPACWGILSYQSSTRHRTIQKTKRPFKLKVWSSSNASLILSSAAKITYVFHIPSCLSLLKLMWFLLPWSFSCGFVRKGVLNQYISPEKSLVTMVDSIPALPEIPIDLWIASALGSTLSTWL